MLIRSLLLLDSDGIRERIVALLNPFDVDVTQAPLKGNFWDRIADEPSDLILISRNQVGDPVAETIESIIALSEEPDVVILSEMEDAIDRAQLLAAGATAVLSTQLPDQLLGDALESFIERRREFNLSRVEREIAQPEYSLSDFDSGSPVMKNFMRMVRRVVEPDSSLLILGETGVGKERLARAIHSASPRKIGPFVPVNCAAFPETLLDGELFGYEEGAFTGASGDRRGYFEMAHGGTIFLDEIGELPRHLQVKLLRVLQERRIQPLGSEKEIEIDVRVFAATNRDLEEEIVQRRFRRDLYYRLSVVALEIPPLREHREDIPILIQRYLAELTGRMNRTIGSVAPTAMDALCHYAWPGNIRELINVVERAIILCEGQELTLDTLPRGIGPDSPAAAVGVSAFASSLITTDVPWSDRKWTELSAEVMDAVEREYLEAHLRAAAGRLNEVSRTTGIKPRTLYKLLTRHGIDKLDYKSK